MSRSGCLFVRSYTTMAKHVGTVEYCTDDLCEILEIHEAHPKINHKALAPVTVARIKKATEVKAKPWGKRRGMRTYADIAKAFGVSRSLVEKIARGVAGAKRRATHRENFMTKVRPRSGS